MTSLEIIKNLCEKEGINISALEKEMGYSNGSLAKSKSIKAERLMEIAARFGVNMEYLMTGEEPEQKEFNPQLTAKDERDISKKVDGILSQLHTSDALMFDGEPMDDETKELLRVSLENGVKIAKIAAKKKFTPKKYR
ncbi:transcriptional regulator [Anaerotignum sp. MB30-C6]|uniref:transcriptional regulator n=1 Tax=Anaerotignum sp. MB30-C6 TaxID=3070814 RepID=UPI0027DCB72E|nr:transcriptional regulator [Anaerotignum sp. MB30-C6]WMI80951.1 transcriptional regulator [Anaerotignum sp. MB30-C6]